MAKFLSNEIGGKTKRVLLLQIKKKIYQNLKKKEKISHEEIAFTCGVSGAVDLALQLFSKPGDEIIVEDPTYYEAKNFITQYNLTVRLILKNLKSFHFIIYLFIFIKPVPFKTTSEGFDVDSLEKKLINNEIHPKLMYIVSVFSNPCGLTLSEEKRIKLVQLAHQFNFLILSDEVYQLLYFKESAKPPKPLSLFDLNINENHPGGVVSLGSISKTIMPSLRIGWILCKNLKKLKIFYQRAVETSGGLHSFYTAGLCKDFHFHLY